MYRRQDGWSCAGVVRREDRPGRPPGRLATDAERERLWPEFEAFYPGYAAFIERDRPRTIPTVMLELRPA
jgi:hypothetical protein